jgi:CBS domain-containing protein
MKVEQLMSRDLAVCEETETANRAAELMWEHDCGFVPIVSGNGVLPRC